LAALLVLLTSVSGKQCVYADLTPGISLGAQEAVNQFNALNNNTGFHFDDLTNGPVLIDNPNFGGYTGVVELKTTGGYDSPDLTAYGGKGFLTFCVQPGQDVIFTSSHYIAQLNYDGKYSSVVHRDQSQTHLTVGAAFLYKEFVLGNLDHLLSSYGNDADAFGIAVGGSIRFLMGYDNQRVAWVVNNGNQDLDNKILIWLLSRYLELTGIPADTLTASDIGDIIRYLESTYYEPDAFYDEIGYYSVFVMNVEHSPGNLSQNFIYLANMDDQPYVPEPATVLLWTLGTVGMFCYSRKRSVKK